MRRFFFSQIDRQDDLVKLSAEESHHLIKVLRLGVGSDIELLDGEGLVQQGTVESLGKQVTVRLGAVLDQRQASCRPLWFAQGLLKGDKMEMVVQKATELGADRCFVVQMERVQGRLASLQQTKKIERWRRIILESCKQCGRSNVMQLDFAADLDSFLQSLPENCETGSRLLFWEEEQEHHLGQVSGLATADPLLLLLGPEGGVSAAEVTTARTFGFQTISMGKRILRAETAAVSALAIAQYLRGNI